MLDWFQDRGTWVWWVGGGSLVTFVVTLLALPVIVVRMRADYFVTPDHSESELTGNRNPLYRVIALAVKNVIGALFVLAGIAMMFLPGQGLLTILIGVTLLDFPGKRDLELRIVRRRPVRLAIGWMRARAGKQPLMLPEA